MSGTLPAPELAAERRSALVIATGVYADEQLARLRSPARDAEDLAAVLGDPAVGAFEVTVLADRPAHEVRLGVQDFLAGHRAGDLLVVYLSCHGVLDARNQLYFAATDTRKTYLAATGIESQWLLDRLDECKARRQVLILDCCFSGAFAAGAKGGDDLDLQQHVVGHGRGRVVLTASRARENSFEGHALPGAAIAGSVFTAGLVEGLRTGGADGDRDGLVSVEDAYDYAYTYVQARGAAQTPQRWAYGAEGRIWLARNRHLTAPSSLVTPVVARQAEAADSLGGDREAWWGPEERRRRANAIFDAAIRAAYTIVDRTDGASALAAVAKELARDDPHRAVQLFGEAGNLLKAEPHTATYIKALAGRAVQGNPQSVLLRDEAERLAHSAGSFTMGALADVAEFMAPGDPQRADRLAATITDRRLKAPAVAAIAEHLARLDPDRAEHLASSIREKMYKAMALAWVARAVAEDDAQRADRLLSEAERVACSIRNEDHRLPGVYQVAKVLAQRAPQRAVLIGQGIADGDDRARVLADIAAAAAHSHRDHGNWLLGEGERIAQSIPVERYKASALAEVAKVAAATDPGRAARLLHEAEILASSIPDDAKKVNVLINIARAASVIDLSEASRITHAIADKALRRKLLGHLAAAASGRNPEMTIRLLDEAESLVLDITGESGKARALAELAGAAAGSLPQRAARLLREAEGFAQTITPTGRMIEALVEVAHNWLSEDWPSR